MLQYIVYVIYEIEIFIGTGELQILYPVRGYVERMPSLDMFPSWLTRECRQLARRPEHANVQTRLLKDNPHQSSAVNINRIYLYRLCGDFLEFIFTEVWILYPHSVEQMDFCSIAESSPSVCKPIAHPSTWIPVPPPRLDTARLHLWQCGRGSFGPVSVGVRSS